MMLWMYKSSRAFMAQVLIFGLWIESFWLEWHANIINLVNSQVLRWICKTWILASLITEKTHGWVGSSCCRLYTCPSDDFCEGMHENVAFSYHIRVLALERLWTVTRAMPFKITTHRRLLHSWINCKTEVIVQNASRATAVLPPLTSFMSKAWQTFYLHDVVTRWHRGTQSHTTVRRLDTLLPRELSQSHLTYHTVHYDMSSEGSFQHFHWSWNRIHKCPLMLFLPRGYNGVNIAWQICLMERLVISSLEEWCVAWPAGRKRKTPAACLCCHAHTNYKHSSTGPSN